jgi:hypothetical protein
MQPLRLIAIDWSGRIDLPGQRRHIWAGIWTRTPAGTLTLALEAGRTRAEIGPWLIALARETPRLVVSIDCCFSFPAWFLREHACPDVFSFWRQANSGLADRWLAREAPTLAGPGPELAIPRDERFWGKPHKRPPQFCGPGYRTMFRHTDWDNKVDPSSDRASRLAKMRGITPKSPFQIGGSGSVGTGSLRAMPTLLALHEAGFRIWPFESSRLSAATPAPLLVEMYTRLMTGPVAKSNPTARRSYLAQRRREDPIYVPLTPAVLRKAQSSEDAFDALVSTLEMARHGDGFARLRGTRDPDLRLEGITWRPGVRP